MDELTRRPDPADYHAYYGMYVERVPAGDLRRLLADQLRETAELTAQFVGDRQDRAYAPGKWTVRQVFQHVADTERVMGYRLLCFARRDPTPLPGFDQDDYVLNGIDDHRDLAAINVEFTHLRRANLMLIEGFDDRTLDARGRMWDKELTVLSLCLLLHGHVAHHLDVLRDRYLDA